MMTIRARFVIGLSMVGSLFVSMTSTAVDYQVEHLQILSKLQAMSGGTYSDTDWNEVYNQLDVILDEARANEDWNRYVDAQVIRAKALVMQSNDGLALAILQDTLREFENADVPEMKKAYVEIAAIETLRANPDGVSAIMKKFSESRHYDRETYSATGGAHPGDPIVVERPNASGEDSISMTAMRVYETKVRYGRGQPFPDFSARSSAGVEINMDQFKGRVLLVDFWTEGWPAWMQDLAYRKSVYDRHHDDGFEILGFSMGPDTDSAQRFVRANGIEWPQAVPPPSLMRTLGIFGEVNNYLLDRNGIVIGRNLYGADLEAAVAAAVAR